MMSRRSKRFTGASPLEIAKQFVVAQVDPPWFERHFINADIGIAVLLQLC